MTDLANFRKRPRNSSFLKWFVDEQVEERSSANKILQQLGNDKGLYRRFVYARQGTWQTQ